MTGVSSTMVNFTVYDFLRRADKISLLQSIKTENQTSINGNSIRFPNHHKHMKNNDGAVGLTSSNDLIQRHDIERVVNEAFIASRALVEPLIGENFFHQNEITSPMDLLKHVGKLFSSTTFRKKSSEQTNRKNCSFEVVNDGPDGDENEDGNDDGESEEESEDECENEDENDADENEDENDADENENDNDDDENEEENEDGNEEENEDGNEEDDDDQYEDKQTDEINSDDDQETECIAELVLDCSDASFNGMRVKETIETPKSFTYFEVRRRNDTKNVFIHKQTAAWLLSNEKTSLSSDRLKRVTQR